MYKSIYGKESKQRHWETFIFFNETKREGREDTIGVCCVFPNLH